MPEMAVESLSIPFRVNDPQQHASFPVLEHLSFRLKLYRWILGEIFPGPRGRLLDLGAGPGHFARIASRHGFAVTALDARAPWTLSGDEAKSAEQGPFAHREFEFIQQDLREVEDVSGFEVVACIGVLYHLTLADQQRLLARCSGQTIVIDTELYDAGRIPASRADRFTTETSAEGYAGALCREHDQVYSSHGNAESFWFDEASILRFFADTGRRRITMTEPAYYSAFGPRRWYVLHA